MSIYLEAKAKMICIDFFGFPIGIPDEWYIDGFYLAMDINGEVYCYNGVPEKRDTHWAWIYTQTSDPVIADRVLDVCTYEHAIPDVDEWVSSIWSKEAWPITTFPVLRTA